MGYSICFRNTYFGSCVFCAPLHRYIGEHIDRLLTDVSVDISADKCRSTYRPMYISRVMVDISTKISADSRPLSAYTLTIDCRRSISRLSVVYQSSVSYNISKKLRLSVTGVNKAVASGGEMGVVATRPPPPRKKYIYFGTKIPFSEIWCRKPEIC